MSDLILIQRDGPIATVVINNPAKRNALSRAAWLQLGDVFTELSDDDDLRCIVVRGAGTEAFAAGADISEFPAVRANAEQARAYGVAVAHAMDALTACRHPTIAMILGACTGGGLEIACACDLRISGESGRFGVPINRIGHPMAYPELKAVQDVVGRAVVLELLLEGGIVDAAGAERRGLLTRVVADDGVEEETYAAARRIARGAPLAARANKRFARRLEDPAHLTPEEADEAFQLCDSEDYQHGFRAFLAKKKPEFQGR